MRIRRAKYEAMRAETARLRRELAAQQRVNDRLSDQLMHSMGYTSTGLERLGTLVPDQRGAS
ncbi:hypothetical protein [Streptomyces lunaelactis]|uniref:hypothetical protein n=1 Tax=Streptomyces lunaelactis TaxID=1535768 RepID=UPI0015848536|nr:hypothetical protein [Streptomyces lunaelactis]NUK22034.1 hypothetical protein [Streptomyces lunaelactis]